MFAGELLSECIMPRLNVEEYLNNSEYRVRTNALVENHRAGGFCVFGESPEAVAFAVGRLQDIAAIARSSTHLAGTALLFSCDCEFGLRMRLKRGGTEFPDAMAMAKSEDPDLVRRAGRAIAEEMRALGLTWNFAPVADVNSNPKNPIINTRSFGDDPETVIHYSLPFLEGLQSGGVAGCAKHFPGHGDTSVDSHHELPYIEGGLGRFQRQELPPFQALITAGVASVMTGHLACPDIAGELGALHADRGLPATLSPVITTSLLRQQLGFDGVIVTDAMEMHAITKLFGEEEASVRALEAGADVLLMPVDPNVAYHALVDAVDAGRITVGQLRDKVARIWRMRQWIEAVGLPLPANAGLLQALESHHKDLSRTIARKAIQLTGKVGLDDASLIVIYDDREQARDKAKYFASKAMPFFESVTSFTPQEWQASKPSVDDRTIIATFHRARGYLGEVATDWTLPRIMASIAEGPQLGSGVPLGLILIGSPYLDMDFEVPPQFVLKTFSESLPSIIAALERLFGIPYLE